MQISVYDIYVKRTDGGVMHFDVIVPAGTDPQRVIEFGETYLKDKPVESATLTTEQCRFCHDQPVTGPIEREINGHGYFIYEMEGCDS